MNIRAAVVVVGIMIMASRAPGQNVVINPGFETGSLVPWCSSGDATQTIPRSGNYCAELNGWQIGQSFPAIPVYRIGEASFWLRHGSLDKPPAGSFAWYGVWMEERDGTPLFGAVPLWPWTTEWQRYEVGLGPHPDCVVRGISFGGYGSYVDDVSIVTDARQVLIDIRPNNESNDLHLPSRGELPVAVLGSETFDVHEVNPPSVKLEGALPVQRGRSGKAGDFRDVNGDSYIDLVLRYPIDELNLRPGTIVAEVSGELSNGAEFFGTDAVHLLGAGEMLRPVADEQFLDVPEPGTLSLLALGGLALLRRRRGQNGTGICFRKQPIDLFAD